MDKVEIDPKLFITCRLCLNDMGVYQIVPIVQEQIKYCFDIDVEPFDGLPQLICKKCESVLTEFSKIKSEFSEKQKGLRKNLESKNAKSSIILETLVPHQQETVTSSQQVDSENEKTVSGSKKTIEQNSYLTEELNSDSYSPSLRRESDVIKRKIYRRKDNKWKAEYQRKIVCRFCKKTYTKRYDFEKHHLAYHDKLSTKHREILSKPCKVVLNKIDNLHNMTGMDDTVVLNKNRIIQDENDSNYHILYISKQRINKEEDREVPTKKVIETRRSSNSSDDFVTAVKNQYKRRRLLSEASNDTLIIEENQDSIPSDIEENRKTDINVGFIADSECINIDDSSDTASIKSNGTNKCSKELHSNDVIDYKTINNIISMCHNKYLKKIDDTQSEKANVHTNFESHLKHKVLSLGRKVITKRGFNCTGLLRYLEYKNLDVKWSPTSVKAPSKESGFVQVNAKLRGPESNVKTHWKTIKKTDSDINTDSNDLGVGTETNDDVHTSQVTSNETDNNTSKEIYVSGLPDGAVLCNTNYLNTDSDNHAKNKLLNAHPVANPKQIPKKGNSNNTAIKHVIQDNILDFQTTGNLCPPLEENMISDDIGLTMPIITSTTSLAPLSRSEKKDESNKHGRHENGQAEKVDKSLPRIKVKPVSELMPAANTHPNALYINNLQNTNQSNYHLKNMLAQPPNMPSNAGMSANVSFNSTSEDARPGSMFNREWVIMDTVELPNAKTKSPFEYFKKLLQIHNITFEYSKINVTQFHLSLIKFKLEFKQDPRNCVLCLSLFYHNHGFFLNIKDSSQNDIDVKMLTPNWQWEVLKVYRGDIVKIVLTNAQKAGTDVYEDAHKFVCLLKSINFKKLD